MVETDTGKLLRNREGFRFAVAKYGPASGDGLID